MNVFDRVFLQIPEIWLGHGCDVHAQYIIWDIKLDPNFGSGVGVRVRPAIQPNHRDGDGVWYDAPHFLPAVSAHQQIEEVKSRMAARLMWERAANMVLVDQPEKCRCWRMSIGSFLTVQITLHGRKPPKERR